MNRESRAPRPRVPSRPGRNWVLLRADTLRLLLPQQEVGAAEYIEHDPRPTATPGLFEYGAGDGLRRIVALSGQMRSLSTFPGGRFVLTRLLAGEGELSFAWSEVRVLIDAEFEPHPLPAALRAQGAPIDAYVEHDGEVLLCSTASAVLAYAASPRS